MVNRDNVIKISNYIILIFLTLQLITVSFTIAGASISFGFWGGVWVLQMIFLKTYKEFGEFGKEIKYVIIFLFSYCIIEIISRIFSVMPYEFYDGLKRMPLILLFFITILKIPVRKTLYKVLLFIVSAFSIVSIIELIMFGIELSEIIRTGNFLGNRLGYFSYPITTAEMKLLVFVAIFPVFAIKDKEFKKIKLTAALLLFPILLSMVLTMSRNVYISLVVAVILYAIFLDRKSLIYITIILIIIWFILPVPYKARIYSIFQPADDVNIGRLVMWKTGWTMFLDHPVLGIGDCNFIEVYQKYKPLEYHGEGSHMHNNFLQILVTTGIIGTIAFWGFMSSLFIVFVKLFKKFKTVEYKMLTFGSILVLISLNIAGIFEWNYGDWEVACVFWFLCGIPFLLNKFEKSETKQN